MYKSIFNYYRIKKKTLLNDTLRKKRIEILDFSIFYLNSNKCFNKL